jgi:glycerophosphoryl diester phosphodiesterase
MRHLTMEQLKELNAAASWATNPTFQFIPIAKLSELIALLEANLKMRANIEIKPRDPALGLAVGEMIMKAGLQDRILIASAFSKVLKPFRKEYPKIATSASVWEIFKFQLFRIVFGLPYELKTDAIQWHSKMWFIPIITERFVKKAKEQGLIVHAWTVNEPEEMARMIKLRVETTDKRGRPIRRRVDAIITDYPTILMKILNR